MTNGLPTPALLALWGRVGWAWITRSRPLSGGSNEIIDRKKHELFKINDL